VRRVFHTRPVPGPFVADRHGVCRAPCRVAWFNAGMNDAHSPHPLTRPYLGQWPRLGRGVYIDPAATVIGDVEIGEDSSIWPATVVRGDVNFIRIGARTNLQDGTVVHVSHDGPHAKLGGFATRIGNDVTIGHKAIIHACTIEDAVLIGMGAIILDGAVVKKHAFVGAGALVPPGKVVGEGEMWLGSPAKCARRLSDAEIEALYYSAGHYVRLKDQYLDPSSVDQPA
jgi:carbonic anhydrase/acetyltransferase-like protein (isoleucine patch superfamily)